MAGSYNVISSPAHYARFKIQPIDFIEANGLDFLQASVLKYLVRFPFKNGVEDLHKARDMLNRLIKREEEKKVETNEPKREDYSAGAVGWSMWAKDYREWRAAKDALVRDAGQEVGGQPATGNAEDRRDPGHGTK